MDPGTTPGDHTKAHGTRGEVDPQVRKILRAAHAERRPGMIEIGPQRSREGYEKVATMLDVAPAPLALVDDIDVPLDGHTLTLRRYFAHEPQWTQPQPALLYFHGGGFMVGSIATHDRLCRRLAALSGCAVLSLDYRLAPENKFPAAVDDAFDTLDFVRREAASLGVDEHRLAVGGDSAGGTLAAATALHARDRGIALALQLLIYPGLSSHQQTASHDTLGRGYILEAPIIQWFFENYLRSDDDRNDWRFAPLVRNDLQDLAPAFIALAEYDPLIDEGREYAARLEAAGNRVDLRVYPGMIHAFFQHGGLVKLARKAHEDAARAMREALRPEAAEG